MRNSFRYGRRRFLTNISGIALAGAVSTAGWADCQVPGNAESSLRLIGRSRGITVGAAVSSEQLANDSDFVAALLPQCSSIVPEWEMKWATIHKERGRFDFAGTDAIARFARRHCLRMRGHPLVWHAAMPPWVIYEIEKGDGYPFMKAHIQTTISRYRDVVNSWDVVNEAVRPEDGQRNGLRSSPWLRALGPEYIDMAFELARKADPKARLVLNDYNIEYEDSKAQAVLSLIKGMRDRGIPIDAVGLQSHLWVSRRQLKPTTLRDFCRSVTREHLDIVITELDIRESDYAAASSVRDARVADIGQKYLETVFAEVTPKEVTLWGLSDRYSWLSKPRFNPENPQGYLNRGLPFDTDLRPKPLWRVLRNVIASAPQRNEAVQ